MDKKTLKKIYITVFTVIVVILTSFYFLAGDQLKYRESRSNINITNGNSSTKELIRGNEISQYFINRIDRFKKIELECTTYYRENDGYVYIYLFDGDELLGQTVIKASKLKEGDKLVLELDDYVEDRVGHQFRIYVTGTSNEGHGISLLTQTEYEGEEYYKDGDYYGAGSICFSASGEEYIFTGQHYWQVATAIGAGFGLILLLSYYKYTRRRFSYIVSVILAIKRYAFLISQLVARDFKTKYKRSVLGVFWSFLNPLLTMTVQYVVFSTLFRNDIQNYAVYLLAGIVSYSFFNEVTTMCLQSISGNANLIKKVYIPKYIFPLSRTLSSSVNLLISLIPLILIMFASGLTLHKSFILMFFFLLCLVVFSLGIGMILSALMVFFRDIQFLWSVIVMVWQYATPIFYSPNIIPPRFSFILTFNPIFQFIKNIRICIMDGISPEPRAYAYCFLCAVGCLLVGSLVFKKTQDKFTLYL